jgi:Zn-dependent peptidase ImmA (M78 family)
VLGATWFEDKRVVIDDSLLGKEGRFAFTVAHEAAHWYIHRPYVEAEKVTLGLFAFGPDAKPSPAVVCRSESTKPPAEWQADQFAARLLMPPADVRMAVESLRGAGPVAIEGLEADQAARRQGAELRMLASEVLVRGNFSNVSNQAMCIRLLQLGLVVDPCPAQPRLV